MFQKLFQNTRKPQGILGKIMVAGMNSGHARLAQWGMQDLPQEMTGKLLDIGCGGGANLAVMLRRYPNGTAEGLDYSEISVAAAQKKNTVAVQAGRCRIQQGDVAKLPYDADCFDLVTAFETVYFWPDMEQSFRQVFRVLKPGGRFLICNESDGENETETKWEEIIDGMKIYQAEELSDYLKKAGFSSVRFHRSESKHWLCVMAEKSVESESAAR